MDSDSEIFEIKPMYYLQQVSSNGTLGKCHYLKPPKVIVGRSQGAEIPILSKNVSRNHATLNHTNRGWTITDNKSFNGVYIDCVKINSDTPKLLKAGQVISLGPADISTYKFEFHAPTPKQCSDEVIAIIEPSTNDVTTASSSRANRTTPTKGPRFQKCPVVLVENDIVDVGNDIVVVDNDIVEVGNDIVEVGSVAGRACVNIDSGNAIVELGDAIVEISNDTVVDRNNGSVGRANDAVDRANDAVDRANDAVNRVSDAVDRAYDFEEATSPKKPCSGLELSLNERLDVMKSMMVNYDEIDQRIRNILNKSEEQLNQNSEEILENSQSLLYDDPVDDHLWYVPEHMDMDDHMGATQSYPTSQRSSQHNQENEEELRLLKERCDELKQKMKEQEQLLREELDKKDAIIEQQNEEKKKFKEKEEKLRNEGKMFEQNVKEEVGKQIGSIMDAELTCSICTEMFVKAVTLECMHIFCLKCLTTWKRTKNECPICRAPITRETRSLNTDNLIERMVEKLSPELQERRKAVLKEHEMPKPKPPRQARTTKRQSTSRRGRGRQQQNVYYRQPTTAPNFSTLLLGGNILSPMFSLINDMTDPDVREITPSEYYGGHGRCYNCGMHGHWANTCPEMY